MYLKLDRESLVHEFVKNLAVTNRGYNFYVNWNNARDFEEYRIELNAMNALIHNNDFDEEFKRLLNKLPSVVYTFPMLFALSRAERVKLKAKGNKLIVVNSLDEDELNDEFDFSVRGPKAVFTDKEIEKYLEFFINMGLKDLMLNLVEKSLIDYVIGVLVGLDTNGRKNRGGLAFELACTPIIKEVAHKFGFTCYEQTTFKKLKKEGFNLSRDIENRKADFILVKGKKAINIEVNFFSGPGSKPEEIVDSYINRQHELKNLGIDFIFITDGLACWGNETKSQLLKAFNNLSYFMNLNLAKKGMLEEAIVDILGVEVIE